MYMTEPLSGGLVTARDPAFLSPGELVAARNSFYFPNDDALYRAPGYAAFGYYNTGSPSSARSIVSLVGVRYEGGQQYLVGQGDGHLVYIDPETSGNVIEATEDYSSGTRLNAVHFKNRWYLFNGVNDNVVMKPGPVFRRHGLTPVSAKPGISIVAQPFALSTSGTYEYWYTEVAKYSDGDEVESAYSASEPASIQVTDSLASHAPQLTFPAQPINSEATHYRVYRGASIRVAGDASVFPVGYQVAEFPISTSAWTDGGTSTTTSGYAASADIGTRDPLANGPGTGLFQGTTSATGAPNSAGALYTNTSPGSTNISNGSRFFAYNFGLAPTGNIVGIKVDVTARTNDPTRTTFYASIGKRTGANTNENFPGSATYPSGYDPIIAGRRALAPATTGWSTMTAGSASDDWLIPAYSWTSDVVGSSAFAVCVWAEFRYGTASSAYAEVDAVKVTVTYAGGSGDEYGKTYDYITLELDGESVDFSANMPPPKASMATVFQNSLVMNDVDNPRTLVWTNPGSGDSCPTDAYYLENFGGNESDEITFIGTVSGRLIVGMRGSLWRVNYLPNENDASINRMDAVSPISTSVGILHSRAACLFVTESGTEGLALASHNGVFATDGLALTPLAGDLLWCGTSGVVPANFNTNTIYQLSNDPGTQTLRLLMSYNAEYVMSYSKRHRKPEGGKWTGPNYKTQAARQPGSVAFVQLNSGAYVGFYAYQATVSSSYAAIMREDALDTGYINSIQATSHDTMFAQTRDIYAAGLDGEVQVQDAMWYGENLSGATPSPDATLTLSRRYLRAAASDETMESSTTGSGGKLLFASASAGRCAGFSIGIAPTTTDFVRLYTIHPRIESFGSSDNA